MSNGTVGFVFCYKITYWSLEVTVRSLNRLEHDHKEQLYIFCYGLCNAIYMDMEWNCIDCRFDYPLHMHKEKCFERVLHCIVFSS